MTTTTHEREFTSGILAGLRITVSVAHADVQAARRYEQHYGREIKPACGGSSYIDRAISERCQ